MVIVMLLYIEKIISYGTYNYPHYLNLKNNRVYYLDEVLSKFRYQNQKEVEQSQEFIRLFYLDYNELVREFIEKYNDPDLTEASKTWTDEERFDIEFRRYIDGDHPLENAWYKYRDDRLCESAIAWCEKNNIRYSNKKYKRG